MRVAVVGGGVIGAGIAWRLARRGADVVVIEDRARAGAASAAAGGMLAPLAEAERPGPFLDLGLESLRRWPDFAAQLESETGLAIGYVRAGRLVAALSAAEADDLASAHAWQTQAADAPAEWLDGAQARRLEPALSPHVRAGILIRDDHRVDNVALADALERAARNAGALWLPRRAERLLATSGRATGVEADGERVAADAVVVAAGAWSARLEGLPRALPIRPVRGQMLALRPSRALFGRTLAGSACYLVPRLDGRVVIGSTMEEADFDATTTPDALAALRLAAVGLVPALADAARAGAWAGLRPATPDELPILGGDPSMPGLFWATGHFRNGILLTPVTADAVAAAVMGASEIDLAPFGPGRFDPGAAAASAGVSASGRARATPADAADDGHLCDLCGAPMYEVHCKVICSACGYKRDCSDLW